MTLPNARDVPTLAMQVDRNNVLQARALLLQEADRLDAVLQQVRITMGHVERCGADPVSADAAVAFPERIAAFVAVCQQHNDHLRTSADELAAAARTYGYTEAEVVAAIPTMGPVAAALAIRDIADRAQ